MYQFIRALSHDEQALLGHVVMQYLDGLYADAGMSDGSPSHWSSYLTREQHELTINGTPLTVEGFTKANPEFTSTRAKDQVLSENALNLLGNLSHYRPENPNKAYNRGLSQPQFGAMTCGRRSGGMSLFDHPVSEQHCVVLAAMDACFYPPPEHDPRPETRISGGTHLWDVYLSDIQFTRMIRGEFAEVPCTISRSFGYLNDEPDNDYLETSKLRQDVEDKIDDLVQPLKQRLDELYGALSEGKLNGKARLAGMIDLVTELEQDWQGVSETINKTSAESIAGVRRVFMERLVQQVEQDVKAMPKADQQVLLGLIKDIE